MDTNPPSLGATYQNTENGVNVHQIFVGYADELIEYRGKIGGNIVCEGVRHPDVNQVPCEIDAGVVGQVMMQINTGEIGQGLWEYTEDGFNIAQPQEPEPIPEYGNIAILLREFWA